MSNIDGDIETKCTYCSFKKTRTTFIDHICSIFYILLCPSLSFKCLFILHIKKWPVHSSPFSTEVSHGFGTARRRVNYFHFSPKRSFNLPNIFRRINYTPICLMADITTANKGEGTDHLDHSPKALDAERWSWLAVSQIPATHNVTQETASANCTLKARTVIRPPGRPSMLWTTYS